MMAMTSESSAAVESADCRTVFTERSKGDSRRTPGGKCPFGSAGAGAASAAGAGARGGYCAGPCWGPELFDADVAAAAAADCKTNRY